MSADLTTYDAALKETWTSNSIEDQIYNENPFLDRIEKTTRHKVGAQAVTPIHTKRNGGFTAVSGSGRTTLNTAGQQGTAQAIWNYKHFYQQIELNDSLLEGTGSEVQAVVNALDFEVEQGVNDMKHQLTRQAFLSGDALIAQCATTTAANTVVLNATSGFNAVERGWLFVGGQVDIGTTGNEVSVADGRTITAIDDSTPATPTITIDGAVVTTSSSHYVSYKDSRTGTTSREMNGLGNIVSTTADLGGIAVATEATWKSAYVDATVQALDTSMILVLQRKIKQKGGEADYVLTSLKQRAAFYDQLQTQVQFMGDKVGYGADQDARWNGMEIQAHPDCQNERLYLLSLKNMFILASDKPKWQNATTGGNILDYINGTDSFGATLSYHLQLGTDRRVSTAALTGLS